MRPMLLTLAALTVGCAGNPAPPPVPETNAAGERVYRLGSAIPGTAVTFLSGNEIIAGVVYRPAGGGPFPAVVVLHEDHGLTDWVKRQAQRLAAKGYLALAVDLFRGQRPDNVEDAHIIERGLPDGRAVGDVKAALDWLAARKDVRPDAVAVIGWDMGAGYALDAAVADRRIKAAVICYGRLTTDADLLRPMAAHVLGVFGAEDVGIDPKTVAQFQKAMAKAGKRSDLLVYPKVAHGFMNPDTPTAQDTTATDAAWKEIFKFLAAEFALQ